MILRNKRISQQASEIQLSLSYGVADVRKMVQWMYKCYFHKGCDWLASSLLAQPHTEQELLGLLASDPQCFGNYQTKWAETLAQWALNVSLREKIIIKSATEPNTYFFTDLAVAKKIGRPPKI